MYQRIRKPLFAIDAEFIHDLALSIFHVISKYPKLYKLIRTKISFRNSSKINVFGLEFPNRVGLAAGFDKNGEAYRGLSLIGFGHIEIGTVTPLPQYGNPKPRIFRVPRANALINRMGFPGKGCDYVLKQLTGWRPDGLIVGVNIGKNKNTPNESAVEDYLSLFNKLAPISDYLAINVSSPNTIGLRRLQERRFLEGFAKKMTKRRDEFARENRKKVPLLLKISPDLSDAMIYDLIDVVESNNIDGIIATNTTINRPQDANDSMPRTWKEGGMSGKPLFERSLRVISFINKLTNGHVPVIGVGGIFSVDDAKRMIDSGANLVQIYTGFVYKGPILVREIIDNL